MKNLLLKRKLKKYDDPARFEAWLARSFNRRVGEAGAAAGCPVANYFTEKLGHETLVTTKSLTVFSGNGYLDADHSFEKIVLTVDSLPYPRPTGGELLGALYERKLV